MGGSVELDLQTWEPRTQVIIKALRMNELSAAGKKKDHITELTLYTEHSSLKAGEKTKPNPRRALIVSTQ